jgi:ABC-type polysaccharide/polyol phosphate export permease
MNAVTAVYGARELLWNFTLRELRTKYRRSFLGWTWSMLNPAATVVIYWFVFGVVLRPAAPPLGDPSGLAELRPVPPVRADPVELLRAHDQPRPRIDRRQRRPRAARRVPPRDPRVRQRAARLRAVRDRDCRWCASMLLIAGSPLLPWLPLTVLTGVLLAVFGSGFALALGALSVYFRDMSYLWTIAAQVWFFATPIVYPPSYIADNESIPDAVVTVLEANPMAIFIGAYRSLLYDGTAPSLVTLATLALIGLGTLALGWALFLRLEPRFAEEV